MPDTQPQVQSENLSTEPILNKETISPPNPSKPTGSNRQTPLLILFAIVIVVIISLIVALIYIRPEEETTDSDNLDKTVIGLLLPNLRTERWNRDRDYIIAEAEKEGATVLVSNSNDDTELQILQAKNLILQGIDVLIVIPIDSESASEVVNLAHGSDIKVIAYDRMITNSDLDYYVSFDSEQVGEIQAQGVVDVVNKGNFAYIGGSETDNNAHLLKTGSFKILTPLIDANDITLKIDVFTPDWKQEIAFETVKKYLDEGNTLDGVIAANDGTALGVIQALEEHDLAGKVPVSGQDADLSACQNIVAGLQTLTVYKPLPKLSQKAVELALSIADGQDPKSDITTNNNQKDVPTFLVDTIKVTKDNMMDTVIKDGFHSYDDVYSLIDPADRPAKN